MPPPDISWPEVRVTFAISGELEPGEITRLLAIQPSRQWKRGERVRSGTRFIPVEDGWALSSQEVVTMDGTAEVIAVIERLELVAESLRHVQSRYPDADLRLTLVAYVPTHERAAVPNLELDKQTLRRLADLGVTFEIDYMLLAPEEDAPVTDH